MALNHYLVGSTIVMVGTCALVDPVTDAETPTEPDSVTFRRIKPDGTNLVYTDASPEVQNVAPGVDTCTVTADVVGREHWRYEGAGACAAVAEDVFDVAPSEVV